METPSVIYYEHQFDDSVERSLARSVLNLGNECRALAQENAKLKDENEELHKDYESLADEHTKLLDKNSRLKAEVASLKSLCDNLGMGGKHTVTAIVEENTRLRKAGDAMVQLLDHMDVVMDMDSDHPEVEAWNAAKEGKPSV